MRVEFGALPWRQFRLVLSIQNFDGDEANSRNPGRFRGEVVIPGERRQNISSRSWSGQTDGLPVGESDHGTLCWSW